MITVGELIKDAANVLEQAGIEDPRREARLLTAIALNKSITEIFNAFDDQICPNDAGLVSSAVGRRAIGEPVAYISGEREFWSIPLRVSPATLIPRPDTETLVELAIEQFREKPPQRILDLGTGTGCLLLALLSEFPDVTGIGVDISDDAIAVANQNAVDTGLSDRCKFTVGDWAGGIDDTFDLIVSNPPYIPSEDIDDLDREVKKYEPLSALDGGVDGLDMYRAILAGLDGVLEPNGHLLLEIGIGQQNDISRIAKESGFRLLTKRDDVSGIVRALMFYKKSVGIPEGKR